MFIPLYTDKETHLEVSLTEERDYELLTLELMEHEEHPTARIEVILYDTPEEAKAAAMAVNWTIVDVNASAQEAPGGQGGILLLHDLRYEFEGKVEVGDWRTDLKGTPLVGSWSLAASRAAECLKAEGPVQAMEASQEDLMPGL